MTDDDPLVQQIQTFPWIELPLLGVNITNLDRAGFRLTLTWVEGGAAEDTWSEVLLFGVPDRGIVEEARVFARGAIPVAWCVPKVKKYVIEATKKVDVDRTLCFLLRPTSRWLDPSVWCEVRAGKPHPMGKISKAVGYDGEDPAELAIVVAKRDGFPVRLDWTASELAHWQEDARARIARGDPV